MINSYMHMPWFICMKFCDVEMFCFGVGIAQRPPKPRRINSVFDLPTLCAVLVAKAYSSTLLPLPLEATTFNSNQLIRVLTFISLNTILRELLLTFFALDIT